MRQNWVIQRRQLGESVLVPACDRNSPAVGHALLIEAALEVCWAGYGYVALACGDGAARAQCLLVG